MGQGGCCGCELIEERLHADTVVVRDTLGALNSGIGRLLDCAGLGLRTVDLHASAAVLCLVAQEVQPCLGEGVAWLLNCLLLEVESEDPSEASPRGPDVHCRLTGAQGNHEVRVPERPDARDNGGQGSPTKSRALAPRRHAVQRPVQWNVPRLVTPQHEVGLECALKCCLDGLGVGFLACSRSVDVV